MAIKIIETNLVFASNHSDREGAPKGIVLHHAAADGSVETIHGWHRDGNGWAGIGYHFYVRKDGSIYRGRPEQWLGAHTSGHNDKLGICAEGNFQNETMSDAQKNAIVGLIRHLIGVYGDMDIYGHRDLDATACPGNNYPFDAIVKAAKAADKPKQEDNVVEKFQKAALSDGIALPAYGADGIWGGETERAASELLQVGSRGERVRLMQSILIANGYDLGPDGADGIFGVKTNAAVRTFQSKCGIGVDGIVGVNTWKKLLGV